MIALSMLEELASYVPGLILRRMAGDSAATLTPDVERFPAAVLLADLSGFTALTERLVRANPAGAEELTSILDFYFDHLVSMVIAHGGDVVKFAGDGLLAIWYGNEPLNQLTQRAVQCGLAIQMVMMPYVWGGFGSGPQAPELKLRIGIGAGEIALMHVGGVFGRWELLIAGDPLRQAGQAEAQAQAGEVLIAPAAWELIAHACIGSPLENGQIRLEGLQEALPMQALHLPPLTPGMGDALRAYIPKAVLTRVDAQQTDWIAEQRRVTVLFIHLPDLHADTPLSKAQALMQALQRMLYRYEGSISRLGADSKGPTLMAAFGLPPLAHENDPVRGLRAALDISAALRDLGMACAIGITTGQALCGVVGGPLRHEYTMMGPVVNYAARLMQAASAQIDPERPSLICDATTAAAAREQLSFESLPFIRLKGVADPVPVYRPLPTAAATQPETPTTAIPELLGRSRELALLETLVEQQIQHGGWRLALIEGEAGMGKSRLLRQVREEATLSGALALQSTAQPITGAPYTPWRPIFQALLLELTGIATIEQIAALPSIVADPEVERLLPLLGAVLALELPETSFTAHLSNLSRAEHTRDLLIRLIEWAAVRTPLVITIDDAQWLDASSWALISALCERNSPLSLLIALRPLGTPNADQQRLAYHPRSLRLGIRGLDRTALSDLLARCLEVSQVAHDLIDMIAARAQGNPLFSEELAITLRDAGLIRVRNQVAQLALPLRDAEQTLSGLRLPETVQGLITSRIDRLSPTLQLTLKVASVIGPIFSVRELVVMHPNGLPPEQLSPHLFQLQQAGLIALEALEPELIYAFRPAMVAEVAYNLMSFAQRRRLHRVLASFLAQHPASDQVLHYARLARHWQAAEGHEAALSALGRAGEAALRVGAAHEAEQFFNQALTIAKQFTVPVAPLQQARWQRMLGMIYHNSGQLSASHEHLRHAIAVIDHALPEDQPTLWRHLRREALIHLLRRCGLHPRTATTTTETDLEAARIWLLIGQLAYYENRLDLAIYTVVRALNRVEISTDWSPERANGYAGMQLAFSAIPPLAQIYRRLAQHTGGRTPHLPALLWQIEVDALTAIRQADWRRAQAACSYGIQIAEHVGDQRRRAEFLALECLIVSRQGNYAAAAAGCVRVGALGVQQGDQQVQVWGLAGQAENLLALGDHSAAAHLLAQAEGLLATNVRYAQAEEIWVYGLLAQTALHSDAPQRAKALAQTTLRIGGRFPPTAIYALSGALAAAAVLLHPHTNERTPSAEMRAAQQQAAQMLLYLLLFFPFMRPAVMQTLRTLLWESPRSRELQV